jgi:ribose transport system substrate-binding protein
VSNRLCFVGTDNYAAGRLCAEQLRKAVPEGEVLISTGSLDKENVQRRRQGVIDELLDRSFEPNRSTDPIDQPLKGPHFTIVSTLIDVGSGEDVIAQTVKSLQTHPNLKGMIGLNTASVPRLIEALQQAKQLGKVQVVGFDAAPETLGGIVEGSVAATIVQDQFGVGFHAVRILAENAQGNRSGLPMFQRRTLPVEVVTKENVAAVHGELSKEQPPATRPGS